MFAVSPANRPCFTIGNAKDDGGKYHAVEITREESKFHMLTHQNVSLK